MLGILRQLLKTRAADMDQLGALVAVKIEVTGWARLWSTTTASPYAASSAGTEPGWQSENNVSIRSSPALSAPAASMRRRPVNLTWREARNGAGMKSQKPLNFS